MNSKFSWKYVRTFSLFNWRSWLWKIYDPPSPLLPPITERTFGSQKDTRPVFFNSEEVSGEVNGEVSGGVSGGVEEVYEDRVEANEYIINETNKDIKQIYHKAVQIKELMLELSKELDSKDLYLLDRYTKKSVVNTNRALNELLKS